MGEAKFSTFIVAMLVVSGTSVVLGLLMANLSVNYDVAYSDNYSPDVISKMDELSNLTKDVREKVATDAEDRNIVGQAVDILGDLFSSGYTALRTTLKSFDIFSSMVDAGVKTLNLGETEDVIRVVILSSFFIIVLIGIIISVLVRMRV